MRRLRVDLFAEDRAHEEFLQPLVVRLGRALQAECAVEVVSARGGH